VLRTEAVVELAAIRDNVAAMKAGTPAELMAVVKADGYGHGLVPSARAALDGGATWLGTAIVDEALALRAAGITAPILAWLWTPGEVDTVRRALAAGIDISASNLWQLDAITAAAREAGVLIRPLLGAVAVSPPLIVEQEHIDLLASAIRHGLDAVSPG
jgi:alanine racemase